MVLWTRSWKPFGALKKHLGGLREVFWRPSGSLLEPCVGSLGRLGSILDALSSKMPPRIAKERPNSRFLLKNEKKWKFWVPKKAAKSVPKWHRKREQKKSPPKINFHTFLSKFNENTVFYRSLWASRADSIVFYSEFTRPEGTENHGPCGQNLGKTLIFVFF